MRNNTFFKYILAYIFPLVIVVMVIPIQLHAAGLVNCGNGEYKAGDKHISDACTVTDLFKGVVGVTNFLIAFAGLVATLMIVRAGFNMVVSAGNPSAYSSAKKMLVGAIGGMVLVLLAFVLVNTLVNGSIDTGIIGGQNIFTNPKQFIQGQ
jgi:hypothetical protein